MSGDDYLWDKSGKPDPEIADLEAKLRPMKYEPRALPELRRRGTAAPVRRIPKLLRAWPMVAVAAALIVSSYALLAEMERRAAPRLEARRIGQPPVLRWEGVDARLAVGAWLETGSSWGARVALGEIGHVDVAPRTRLRAKEASAGQHRLELERGSIHAKVDAPPRVFAVTTPAADAIDLGCEYTLDVGPEGDGKLVVKTGWVELERCLDLASCTTERRTSIVPAGARCDMRRSVGPGTPHFDDAPEALVRALSRFDFDGGGLEAMRTVLREARRRDSLSVWHLLHRVDDAARLEVYEALRRLAPPPAGVTPNDVLRLDEPKLDLWRSQLHATW